MGGNASVNSDRDRERMSVYALLVHTNVQTLTAMRSRQNTEYEGQEQHIQKRWRHAAYLKSGNDSFDQIIEVVGCARNVL